MKIVMPISCVLMGDAFKVVLVKKTVTREDKPVTLTDVEQRVQTVYFTNYYTIVFQQCICHAKQLLLCLGIFLISLNVF